VAVLPALVAVSGRLVENLGVVALEAENKLSTWRKKTSTFLGVRAGYLEYAPLSRVLHK